MMWKVTGSTNIANREGLAEIIVKGNEPLEWTFFT